VSWSRYPRLFRGKQPRVMSYVPDGWQKWLTAPRGPRRHAHRRAAKHFRSSRSRRSLPVSRTGSWEGGDGVIDVIGRL